MTVFLLCPRGINHSEKAFRIYLVNKFIVEIYSSIVFISFRWIVEHENPMDLVKIVAMADQVRKMFYE